MYDVILHAFDWRYSDIERNAPRIAELGYGAMLFPPPLYRDENGPEWWQRYQPRDYRETPRREGHVSTQLIVAGRSCPPLNNPP